MTKSYPPIHLCAPGEEISIKDLLTIKLRFKKLHRIRRLSIYDFLESHQQIFLELLPLIFHVNSASLPGFVSSSTPSGVFSYSPSNQALKAARKFEKNFSYDGRIGASHAIDGLYLMGSAGSIAFLKNSDLDIWLCHDTDLTPNEIEALTQKAHAVENWAASLDLEVHFFLMNCEQFRLGLDIPLSTESSGATQHYLLLEEFYRTSIYIAGKSLAWWLVPPQQESNYSDYLNHLVTQRLIEEKNYIDFGGLNEVPAEEFISVTLWHAYKSLRSPYKSLLKLLLMESYASEYPNPSWLCHQIKKAIYQGNFTSVDLDSYVLIYLKVDAYLRVTGNVDRLALARHNFFLKIMDSSGNVPSEPSVAAYREKYLHDIAERCHWPENAIEELMRHRFWDINKAIGEHEIILDQLNHCFCVILSFAQNHIAQNYQRSQDLKLLGRKLYSFLDSRPGKIGIITTRSLVQNKNQALSIEESLDRNDPKRWHLYLDNGHFTSDKPTLKCQTLIEILGWLVINGFCFSGQRLNFRSTRLHLPRAELQQILCQLGLFLQTNHHWDSPLDIYHFDNILIQSWAIVNMGAANPDKADSHTAFSDGSSDVLSYGEEHKCLIQSIDRVSISSWGEIISSHHEGIEGFFDCLISLINEHKKPITDSDLTIADNNAASIQCIHQRVSQEFGALLSLLPGRQLEHSPRYIAKGGNCHYVFQYADKQLRYRPLPSKEELLAELTRPQSSYSPVHFSESALADTPIPLIFRLSKPQSVQFAYQESEASVTVYIVDERGTFFCLQHTDSTSDQLLCQYAVFLESIHKRISGDAPVSIKYFQVRKDCTGAYSYCPIAVTKPATAKTLNLRITGLSKDNNTSYTIHCNDNSFSSLDYGDKLFQEVYQHIIKFRKNGLAYPVHITDIDIPPSVFGAAGYEQLQTSQFLNTKQKIESLFDIQEQ